MKFVRGILLTDSFSFLAPLPLTCSVLVGCPSNPSGLYRLVGDCTPTLSLRVLKDHLFEKRWPLRLSRKAFFGVTFGYGSFLLTRFVGFAAPVRGILLTDSIYLLRRCR